MENSDNNDDGQASSAGYSKFDVDQLLAAMKKQTDEAMSVIQKDVLLEIRRAQANFEEYEVESPPNSPPPPPPSNATQAGPGYPPQQTYPQQSPYQQSPYPPRQTYPDWQPHQPPTGYPTPSMTLMVDPMALDRAIYEAIQRAGIPALVESEVSKLIGSLKDQFESQIQQQSEHSGALQKASKIRSRKRGRSV